MLSLLPWLLIADILSNYRMGIPSGLAFTNFHPVKILYLLTTLQGTQCMQNRLSIYCLSKKSWPILYHNLLHKLGQDFLDIQCNAIMNHFLKNEPDKELAWFQSTRYIALVLGRVLDIRPGWLLILISGWLPKCCGKQDIFSDILWAVYSSRPDAELSIFIKGRISGSSLQSSHSYSFLFLTKTDDASHT